MGRQKERNRRRQEALQAIKDGSVHCLGHLPEEFRNNAEIAVALLEKDERNARHVSARLWSKKYFVLAAVKVYGGHLLHASERLRGNREIVLEAVRQRGQALEHASEELRGDREIVLTAVRQDGEALRFASGELRGDRMIVLEAVRQDGHALHFASEELRSDLEVVMAAVRQDGWALRYHASEEQCGNREIVLAAIDNTEYDLEGLLAEFVSYDIKNDPMVAAAILIRGECLEWGSEIMERLENVLLAVQALPEDFTQHVVDEASVLKLFRQWELSISHKIWMALQLEPPGMEGTGQLLVELSGLPMEFRQARELSHCAPVIGAALSLGNDWRKITSYPVFFGWWP